MKKLLKNRALLTLATAIASIAGTALATAYPAVYAAVCVG